MPGSCHRQNFSSFLHFFPFRHNFSRTDRISQTDQGKNLPKLFWPPHSQHCQKPHAGIHMLPQHPRDLETPARGVVQEELCRCRRSQGSCWSRWPHHLNPWCFTCSLVSLGDNNAAFPLGSCVHLSRVQAITAPNFRVQLFSSAKAPSGFSFGHPPLSHR